MHQDLATSERSAVPGPRPRTRPSSSAQRARRAAQHRRAWIARRGSWSSGPKGGRTGPARTADDTGSAVAAALSSEERSRRLANAADVLVRTIRAVPMPGVPPFSRRDRLLIAGFLAFEALVAVLLGAAGRR